MSDAWPLSCGLADVRLAPFALYFKALALAYVGDLERAESLLTGEAEGPIGLSRRGVLAHIAILSQLGRTEDALELTDAMFGAAPDEDIVDLRAALREGRAIPFTTTLTSASDGMAETYFTLASALPAERGDWLPLIYARLALALRPDHTEASLLAGELLESAEEYDLANAVYDQVPVDDPQYLAVQLAKANALARSGDVSDAVASLQNLARERPESVLVHSALGDQFRREEQFEQAEARLYPRHRPAWHHRGTPLGVAIHPRDHAGTSGRVGARRAGIPPCSGIRARRAAGAELLGLFADRQRAETGRGAGDDRARGRSGA